MEYFSTNHMAPHASLAEAVKKGLAPDKGLYMPERIDRLPDDFFRNIDSLDFHGIATRVACAFFDEDIPAGDIEKIVCDTLTFDTPVINVHDNIYSLELFHGPTLAFKDVGGRFMARMLSYFYSKEENGGKVTVIVATSGDTGSAVANGFLGVGGIDVIVLYPEGKVSMIQEKQFTTLGKNITALEVDGTFDDCQRLVKSAFMDKELNRKMTLTSANSINVARFLPQAFYYFNAYAQLKRAGKEKNLVFSVPSGNFGNITAGLIAWRMGLPVRRFIAANNRNDVFLDYLRTGIYTPRASVQTIANAMDVGDPSNFARVMDLYGNSAEAVRKDITGCSYTDDEIRKTIATVHDKYGYMLDPHGACGYQGLADSLSADETGVFLETAHPAKFKETVESAAGQEVKIPQRLMDFMKNEKKTIRISSSYDNFREYLESRI